MSLFAGGLADRIAGKVDAIDAFDNAFQIAGIANVNSRAGISSVASRML